MPGAANRSGAPAALENIPERACIPSYRAFVVATLASSALGKLGSGRTVSAASVTDAGGAARLGANVILIFGFKGARGLGPDGGFPDIPSISVYVFIRLRLAQRHSLWSTQCGSLLAQQLAYF